MNQDFEEDHHSEYQRMTTKGARRILGMIGNNYSDDEIEQILECLYSIAEEGFESYLRRQNEEDEF